MRRFSLFVATISALFCLASCSASNKKEEVTQIVTTFYPIYDFTKNIVGDEVSVAMIVPPNQEVHEFEPSAKQVAIMSDSQVLVYASDDLEKWTKDVKNKGVKIETSNAVTAIPGDPHSWLSPKEVMKEVTYIADQLEKEYPQYKEVFRKNTKNYLQKLRKLDQNFSQLKDSKQTIIITQHNAFSYLARDYGLKQISIVGLNPDNEPSSSRLITLKETMEKHNIKTIYTGGDDVNKLASTLAKETGAELAVLNTVESVTTEQEKSGLNYISIMQTNYEILKRTLNQ